MLFHYKVTPIGAWFWEHLNNNQDKVAATVEFQGVAPTKEKNFLSWIRKETFFQSQHRIYVAGTTGFRLNQYSI